jgi:hypothetical protein
MELKASFVPALGVWRKITNTWLIDYKSTTYRITHIAQRLACFTLSHKICSSRKENCAVTPSQAPFLTTIKGYSDLELIVSELCKNKFCTPLTQKSFLFSVGQSNLTPPIYRLYFTKKMFQFS